MLTDIFSSNSVALTTIENVLTVLGAISLLIGVIRLIWCFFASSVEWIENIDFKVYDYDPEQSYEENFAFSNQAIYPIVYRDLSENCPAEPTVNYFVPKGAIIKKMVIKKLDESTIESGKQRYKKVKTIKQITPLTPLCMIVDRREVIPEYLLEWKTLYGGKTQYYFYSNMRDTRYDKTGIKYSFGFWAKIRKFIGLI